MKKLSHADIAMVLDLAEKKSQNELAKLVGVSQSQISRVLSTFEDTRALAKATLHAKAAEVAEMAVGAAGVASKRGDGSVALELLDRLEVVPRKTREPGSGGAKVLVVVGQSTPNALPPALQTLDIQSS